MFTIDRIWGNEGAASSHHYITCSGGIIPVADNQGSEFPCGGLFILIQCHHWKANPKQLEGSNIYLPSFSQIPYRVWDRTSTRRLASSERMLFALLAIDEQVQMMNIEERRVVTEPTEVLDDVLLQENDPEKFTRIGISMKEKTREDLVQFLRKSIDVFAWSHDYMPGIDPSVITH